MAEYLRLFLSDSCICPMNPKVWSFILNRFILPKRSPASAAKYASIWMDEGAPLDVYMNSLAAKLEKACKASASESAVSKPATRKSAANKAATHESASCEPPASESAARQSAASCEDDVVCVRVAASYSSPSMEDALGECMQLSCGKVAVIPLYPQSAFATTMAVKRQVTEALDALDYHPDLRFVENYCDEASYINAVACSIDASGFNPEVGDRLLFAFHSIPIADIRAGDTYDEQTQSTAKKVAAALGLPEDGWCFGYQCRFDKSRRWLTPYTTSVLKGLSDAERLFVIAPNFSVDCLETLYDIEQQMRDQWVGIKTRGGVCSQGALPASANLHYIPCLNDTDAHVEVIKGVAFRALGANA